MRALSGGNDLKLASIGSTINVHKVCLLPLLSTFTLLDRRLVSPDTSRTISLMSDRGSEGLEIISYTTVMKIDRHVAVVLAGYYDSEAP